MRAVTVRVTTYPESMQELITMAKELGRAAPVVNYSNVFLVECTDSRKLGQLTNKLNSRVDLGIVIEYTVH